jgi:hypothetical protein
MLAQTVWQAVTKCLQLVLLNFECADNDNIATSGQLCCVHIMLTTACC